MSAGFNTTGRLRRSTAGQIDFSLYNFSGGLNVLSAPQDLADNELTQALNGYLRVDGGFESRRGMNPYNTIPGDKPIKGLFRFQQFVRAGTNCSFVQTLAQSGDMMYDADTKALLGSFMAQSGRWSITMASDPQAPGGLTDVAVICTGRGGPYIWNGTTLYTPPGWSNASGAKWCQVVNGIVWFGGIPGFPTQVMSTGSGQVTDDSFEDIAGYSLFNFGQQVQGICALGEGPQAVLVAGLVRGLSMIFGTGPANYTQQDVPMDDDGVASGATMVSHNGLLYWLGRNNVYSFDGYDPPTAIGLKVQPWIANYYYGYSTSYAIMNDRRFCWAFLYNDRYHLVYDSQGLGELNTILTYDLNVQGWTVQYVGQPILSSALIDAAFDPAPSALLVGSQNNGQIYTWDPFTGTENTLWDQFVWNAALWDNSTTNSDAGTVINSIVTTKFFKVGEPGSIKTLHRVYPEIVYPNHFFGAFIVQTNYQQTTFENTCSASPVSQSLWDVALWDEFPWGSVPPPLSSFNAPQSRIDIISSVTVPAAWDYSLWDQFTWDGLTYVPGIQADAFAFGISTGSPGGGIWDLSKWDQFSWGDVAIGPWILSGLSGSFSQGGKR